jgi:hypothetical protein
MLARRDADRAGGLLPQLAQGSQLDIDLFESRPQAPQQAFARLRRRDAARGPGQQPDSQPLLEATHGVTQRRLRNTQLGRGPGETRLFRHCQESQEGVDVGHCH